MSRFEEQLREIHEAQAKKSPLDKIGVLEQEVARLTEENKILRERAGTLAERTKYAMVNVHTIPQPILMIDAEHRVRYVSDSFLRMTGHSVDTVLRRDASEVLGEIHARYASTANLGVAAFPVTDATIPSSGGKSVAVTVKAFLNLSPDAGVYDGMTFILEPADKLHRFKVMFQHFFSRGHCYEIEARAFAEEGILRRSQEFLTACIHPYSAGTDPKKKTVLVNLAGVLTCDAQTLSHLADQRRFYAEKNYRMLAVGVQHESEIYNCLLAATFPADHIMEEQPKQKRPQKVR